jgi:putative transposase
LYISFVETKESNTFIPKYKECGIDLGIRTYATIYAKNSVVEFATNDCIDKIRTDIKNTDIDRVKFVKKYRGIKTNARRAYLRKIRRLNNKVKNRMIDLQNHLAKFLTANYANIYLGDFKSKSAKEHNKNKQVKKELDYFSHYRFKMKLTNKSEELGNNLKLINEAYTSQNCGKCNNKLKIIGKTYKCSKSNCNYHSDRDHNGARNMFIKATC